MEYFLNIMGSEWMIIIFVALICCSVLTNFQKQEKKLERW